MKQNGINRYLELQVSGVPSLDLLIGMLDFCVSATMAQDVSKTMRGLTALEESLDFRDCPELARVFCRLYEHCRRLISEDRFEEAQNCLRLLRDAWGEARRRRQPAPQHGGSNAQ